ncbi:uncharacterized protein LOC133741974 [Rosa rugosa]|uniref:uncharacterized protein LOC133741974 n=1 Tax=Rosa rugosa TaxID=74645 RepID=UPI002B40B30B|nr:uncharacterized protein LOC133741974 [Rosa rugosa]
MERFFKRTSNELSSPLIESERSKQSRVEIDLANLPSDPGERTKISDYHPNLRDQIRREYPLRGPCQPRNHQFVQTQGGEGKRRFVSDWFNDFPNWLEYRVAKDAAFCLCCYLFKSNVGEQGGGDCFTGIGFQNWKKKERLHDQNLPPVIYIPASATGNNHKSGVGVIIKNHRGFSVAVASLHGNHNSAIEAEAQAVVKGFQLAAHLKIQNIILESDCQDVIRALDNLMFCPNWRISLMINRVNHLKPLFNGIKWNWIPREVNLLRMHSGEAS